MASHGVKFRRRKAAFGSDQKSVGLKRIDCLQGRGSTSFGGDEEAAGVREGRKEDRKIARFGDCGDGQALGLFGGLGGDGDETVGAHAGGLGTGGQHRLDNGDAEFGGLFDHEVGRVALEGGEAEPAIGFGFGGTGSFGEDEMSSAAIESVDGGGELAGLRVEDKHGIAGAAAHHGAQVVRLGLGCGKGRAG